MASRFLMHISHPPKGLAMLSPVHSGVEGTETASDSSRSYSGQCDSGGETGKAAHKAENAAVLGRMNNPIAVSEPEGVCITAAEHASWQLPESSGKG